MYNFYDVQGLGVFSQTCWLFPETAEQQIFILGSALGIIGDPDGNELTLVSVKVGALPFTVLNLSVPALIPSYVWKSSMKIWSPIDSSSLPVSMLSFPIQLSSSITLMTHCLMLRNTLKVSIQFIHIGGFYFVSFYLPVCMTSSPMVTCTQHLAEPKVLVLFLRVACSNLKCRVSGSSSVNSARTLTKPASRFWKLSMQRNQSRVRFSVMQGFMSTIPQPMKLSPPRSHLSISVICRLRPYCWLQLLMQKVKVSPKTGYLSALAIVLEVNAWLDNLTMAQGLILNTLALWVSSAAFKVILRMPLELACLQGMSTCYFLGGVQPIGRTRKLLQKLAMGSITVGKSLMAAHWDSLSLRSNTEGSIQWMALDEHSYSLIAGKLSTSSLIRLSLGRTPCSLPGNSISIYLISSQMEKSIMVRQPRNHSSPLTNCSYFSRRGNTLFFHWFSLNSIFSSSVPLAQLMLMMLPIVSIVHRYICRMPWSAMLLPSSSTRPIFSITYSQMGKGSVSTNSLSIMKGRSANSQSFDTSALYLFHSCRPKNWSMQGTRRYSHSSRGTCALPRIGQYPITIGLGSSGGFFSTIFIRPGPINILQRPTENASVIRNITRACLAAAPALTIKIFPSRGLPVLRPGHNPKPELKVHFSNKLQSINYHTRVGKTVEGFFCVASLWVSLYSFQMIFYFSRQVLALIFMAYLAQLKLICDPLILKLV